MTELERLENIEMDAIPETGLAIIISPALEESSLNKIIELLKCVIQIEKLDKTEDSKWEENLPNWFVQKAKSVTKEELLKDDQLWDIGSWIDAIKQRGWKWCALKNQPGKTIIHLETFTYPYNIDSFFYILYSIGIESERTEIFEIFPNSENLKIIE
ncbi:hypothetical protein ACJD0Z_04285 [Flavobacteriaceae bacterium M23B6Z8]